MAASQSHNCPGLVLPESCHKGLRVLLPRLPSCVLVSPMEAVPMGLAGSPRPTLGLEPLWQGHGESWASLGPWAEGMEGLIALGLASPLLDLSSSDPRWQPPGV